MPYFSGPNGIHEVADPGERFTQAFKESRLARLYGDYFKTGNADLGQLARFDPEGAAKIKAEQERTGLAALLGNIYEAPDDQRQGLIAEAFRKDPTVGMNAAKMFDPRYAAQAEQFTLTPGSARYGPGGKVIASQPYEAKPQAATFQKDAEGNGWWLRPGEAPIPADAASMPDSGASAGLDQPGYGAADFSDPNSFYAAIGNAIAPYNGRITSTTGGQHNPGSLHPGGGAVDVGMGRETPEQQAKILQALQAQGYDVRDERTRPAGQSVWSGPHLHVEPRKGGGGRINFGKAEQPKFQARQYNKDEVAAMGLPSGTVAYTSEDGTPKILHKPDAAGGGQKPMPVRAITEDLEIQSALDANAKAASVLKKHADRMKAGTLKVSPMNTYGGKVREFFGNANANDVNLTELRADMTAIVNEQLRLNKGVQTEGDAQRAYNEIMTSNDPTVVARAVERLANFTKQAAEFQARRRKLLYSNFGRGSQPSTAPASGGFRIIPD